MWAFEYDQGPPSMIKLSPSEPIRALIVNISNSFFIGEYLCFKIAVIKIPVIRRIGDFHKVRTRMMAEMITTRGVIIFLFHIVYGGGGPPSLKLRKVKGSPCKV